MCSKGWVMSEFWSLFLMRTLLKDLNLPRFELALDLKPTLSPSPWLKWNWLKLALIWNWPTSFWSKLTLIWNQPQIETGSKLKLAISRSERPLKRRRGMQRVRSNQPREKRISKNWFRSAFCSPLPRILHSEARAARKLQNYPQGFSLITSTQFMACFMTYISDIFGLGNSFRRMLHTMYVIVLLLKNVPLLRV